MARVRPAQLAFNAGEFGEEMSARIDFQRYPLAASVLRNWMPMAQGGITRRQGFQHVGTPASSSKLLPFESNLDQGFLALAEAGTFKFWKGDTQVSSPSDTCTITNGDFPAGLSGWTDSSTGSATVVGDGSKLTLTVPVASSDVARLDQNITSLTADTDYWVEVTVAKGPVRFMFGEAQGSSELGDYNLDVGQHMLTITPTGTDFWIRIESTDKTPREVTSVLAASASTALEIDNIYDADDLVALRHDQVIDVMFIGVATQRLSSLSRYGTQSFGFGKELLTRGPWQGFGDPRITITPSAVEGSITLTASDALFESGSVGQLIEITHAGQTESGTATAENTFTDDIKISGSGTFREFDLIISGLSAGSATVTLQRSFGSPGAWVDWKTYTTDQSITLDDGLDGSDVWYRVGVKTGDFSSGTISMEISNESGETTGVCEITAHASSTSVTARVLEQIATTDATSIWRFSQFGGSRGYPQNPALHEGRLWISKNALIYGSVSDDYTNFDDSTTEDDRAIQRTVDSRIRWIKDAGELITGADAGERFGQTSNNKAYTPTDFRLRRTANDGAADVDAVSIDTAVLFVNKDDETISEYAASAEDGGYFSTSMTRLNPRIGLGGVKVLAMQIAPERRLWALKDTGELIVLTYLRAEDVVGWSRVNIEGFVHDLTIVRAERQDQIYIRAELNGTQCLLKYADEVWDIPAASNNLDYSHTSVEPSAPDAIVTPSATTGTITLTASASVFSAGDVGKRVFLGIGYGDIASHVSGTEVTVDLDVDLKDTFSIASGFWYMGAKTTSVTGLPSVLEGEEVYARADNIDQGPFTVSGNAITLNTAAAWVHVGRRKDAVFRSLKMFQGAQGGSAIVGVLKRIHSMALALKDTAEGIEVGALNETDTVAVKNTLWTNQPGSVITDEVGQAVSGRHAYDPRCYIVARGGGPATVLAYADGHRVNER